MLSSNLQSILNNRLRYLPKITGDAINSIDWPAKLITIGKKYGLHVDELEDFQGVVMKAMIGMISPEKFQDELITTLALSPTNAEHVLLEVNDEILEPIHDYVMNQGKSSNPLKETGIILEQEEFPISSVPETETSLDQPHETAAVPVPPPFEIPASPEPIPSKPVVSEDFSNFFSMKNDSVIK